MTTMDAIINELKGPSLGEVYIRLNDAGEPRDDLSSFVIEGRVNLERLSAAVDAACDDRAASIEIAARALIDDVRRRYPGEDLRCPHMIALDKAVNGRPA
jgi:hypothetical protein